MTQSKPRLKVELPTSVGSEVAGGNLDPGLLSTLLAYEPQLFFANSWAVRGRAHGTLELWALAE